MVILITEKQSVLYNCGFKVLHFLYLSFNVWWTLEESNKNSALNMVPHAKMANAKQCS